MRVHVWLIVCVACVCGHACVVHDVYVYHVCVLQCMYGVCGVCMYIHVWGVMCVCVFCGVFVHICVQDLECAPP